MTSIYEPEIAEKVAEALLEVKAIKLSPDKPFTWSSGWKSPIYCDNRVTLSYPDVRDYIKTALASLVARHFREADLIAGVATAGIPQGALVADVLRLPFAYVRSKPKGHGMENLIEGHVEAGQKVVVIEDLVSTGGSSLKVVDALREAGCDVLGMAAIFTYGFPAAESAFENKGVNLVCLSTYAHLITPAIEKGAIKEEQRDLLEQWRNSPHNWGY
jgi:orotate phosphoribosyltransferase